MTTVDRTSLHESTGVAVGREQDTGRRTEFVAASSPAERVGGQCELGLRRRADAVRRR